MDLEEAFGNAKRQMPQMPSWFKGNALVAALVAIFVLVTGFTSVYTVPQDSVAVVQRFGQYINTTQPGLNFKLPWGIDKATLVESERQKKMEFGFATPGATNEFQKSSRQEQIEARSMITGDRNAATVDWVVQYRISDPVAYVFQVRNPDATLRDASESVMRAVVGDRTVEEVLTVGRQSIEAEAVENLRALSERYDLGLRIDQIQLKDVKPPRPVEPSFNEVNQAQQTKETVINEARGQYNRAVPRTRGEADKTIAQAEGEAIRRINEAEGDAAAFNAVFSEYSKAPDVTRQRLYLETMSKVLPSFQKRILMDAAGGGILPFLNLDQSANPVTGAR
ncbi:MAG: FtsH protease activity modulator HflK [Verrucomicrobiota bacterium]